MTRPLFNKGDFTLIPNKEAHRGLPPAVQTVYLWLCSYADQNMQSWPSHKTLAEDCGVSLPTLKRALKRLLDVGLVIKSARYNENQPLTNLYRVVILGGVGSNFTPGGVKNEPRGGVKNELLTITNTNYNQELKQLDTNVSNSASNAKTKRNPEIDEAFSYWQQATGLAIASNLKRNRFAASNLLKKHGVEGVRRLIDGAAAAQNDRFAPRISDFVDLQSKLNALLVWGRQQNEERIEEI